MRPIVAHSSSPLTPSARFIDHTLQPLARSYPDYLHNSTSLHECHKSNHFSSASPPPPQFSHLKAIVQQDLHTIGHLVPPLRFVTHQHTTLKMTFVRTRVIPMDEQFIDILLSLDHLPRDTPHVTSGIMPNIHILPPVVRKCKQRRCLTCTHLNCSSHFKSTKTKTQYPIRFSATCTSKILICSSSVLFNSVWNNSYCIIMARTRMGVCYINGLRVYH